MIIKHFLHSYLIIHSTDNYLKPETFIIHRLSNNEWHSIQITWN